MTPVSPQFPSPRPGVHSVCHTTLSLHASCNAGPFLKGTADLDTQELACLLGSEPRLATASKTNSLGRTANPFLPGPPQSLPLPSLCSFKFLRLPAPITKLTRLSRTQAGYCARVRKFKTSLNRLVDFCRPIEAKCANKAALKRRL